MGSGVTAMTKSPEEYDKIISDLAKNTQNATVDAAAKVAALYGAPPEAIAAILRLRTAE